VQGLRQNDEKQKSPSSRCETDRDLELKNRCTLEEPSLVLRPGSWTRPSKDPLDLLNRDIIRLSFGHPDVNLIGISIFKTCLLGNPLRANSRSPLREEYDSECDHRSRRSLSSSFPAKRALRPGVIFASLASDVSYQPHFPGCSSGHHFLPEAASLLLLILHTRAAERCEMHFSVGLFGRTAVRPYKKNMILNMIRDQEDR